MIVMEATATLEKGLAKGLLLVGLESPSHRRRYDPKALEAAVGLYEGVAIYIDHKDPMKGEKRSAHDAGFAYATNPRFVAGKGIVADIKYNTKHPFAPVFEGAIEDLGGKTLSFSHHLDEAFGVRDKDGWMRITKIPAVSSVDIVHKGATTNTLFEEEGPASAGQEQENEMDLTKLTIAQLKEARPDLIKGIHEEVQSDQATKELVTNLQEQIGTLTTQNTELKSKLDAIEATNKLNKRNESRLTAIQEAKLPDALNTETFRTLAVAESTSDELFTQLLEERKALIGGIVTSKGRAPGAPESSLTPKVGESPKDFANRVKGVA